MKNKELELEEIITKLKAICFNNGWSKEEIENVLKYSSLTDIENLNYFTKGIKNEE